MCENEILLTLKTFQASSYRNIETAASNRQASMKVKNECEFLLKFSLVSTTTSSRVLARTSHFSHISQVCASLSVVDLNNSIYHTWNLDDSFLLLIAFFTHCLRLLLWLSRRRKKCRRSWKWKNGEIGEFFHWLSAKLWIEEVSQFTRDYYAKPATFKVILWRYFDYCQLTHE